METFDPSLQGALGATPPSRSPLHWPSVAQVILSLLAAAGMGTAALVMVNTAWRLLQTESSAVRSELGASPGIYNVTPLLMMAASLALCAALALPSAWYAWRRLRHPGQADNAGQGGPPPEHPPSLDQAGSSARLAKPAGVGSLLVLGFLLALGVGGALSAREEVARWVLPPLHLVAIGLPVLGFAMLARYRLPPGSAQRNWGLFGAGLFLGPGLIIVMEMLAAVGVLLVGSFYLAFQPDLARELQIVVEQVETAGRDLDLILQGLSPFLLRPDVGFAVIAFAAVLVPLIEEFLKPIGVWLLAGRRLTPAEGFVAGVLSGAGFALVESLGYAANSREGWATMAFMRVGTAIMHILTSGLTGWGLASAWSQARYARLAAAYLGAVALHGLWNGLAVVAAGASLTALVGGEVSPVQAVGVAAVAGGLMFLTATGLGALIGANVLLRRGAPAQPAAAVATAADWPSEQAQAFPDAVFGRSPALTAQHEADGHPIPPGAAASQDEVDVA